jgi:tetratricopeptide (TPR) repeat protein
MSLLSECLHWSERGLLALDDIQRGGVEEMQLQCSVGIALSFLRAESEAGGVALRRSLEIAEARDDRVNLIGYLSVLLRLHFDRADFRTAFQFAKRARAIAETVEDPAAVALAHSMLGRALHIAGDQSRARVELEASVDHWSRAARTSIYFARENQPMGEASIARTSWLQGYPEHAVARAHEAIAYFELKGHPVVLVVGSIWAMSVFLWAGDRRSAGEYIEKAIYTAESHAFGQYAAIGKARKAQLAIQWGDCKSGVESLRALLEATRPANFGALGTEFCLSLIQGLATLGDFTGAGALADDVLRLVEEKGDDIYRPELLRLKGGVLQSIPEPRLDEAENFFIRSLELSRSQGARAWELRSATDLAALWAGQGRGRDARQLLQRMLAQFTEGFDTPDLKAAARLIATLQ